MKKIFLKTVTVVLIIAGFASATVLADGTPAPMCYPKPCSSS